MKLIGSTIIAVVLFFIITFVRGYYLSGPLVTLFQEMLDAVVQTVIFGVAFHYLHWWVARLFNWYRPEDRGEAVREPEPAPAAARPEDDPLADIRNI